MVRTGVGLYVKASSAGHSCCWPTRAPIVIAWPILSFSWSNTEVKEWQKMGKDRENSSCEWMSGGREVGMGAGLQSIYSVLN